MRQIASSWGVCLCRDWRKSSALKPFLNRIRMYKQIFFFLTQVKFVCLFSCEPCLMLQWLLLKCFTSFASVSLSNSLKCATQWWKTSDYLLKWSSWFYYIYLRMQWLLTCILRDCVSQSWWTGWHTRADKHHTTPRKQKLIRGADSKLVSKAVIER